MQKKKYSRISSEINQECLQLHLVPNIFIQKKGIEQSRDESQFKL